MIAIGHHTTRILILTAKTEIFDAPISKLGFNCEMTFLLCQQQTIYLMPILSIFLFSIIYTG
jgi:hypothetical protein